VIITVVEWVFVAVAAWCVVAVGVGLLIGRAVRMRDRQVPRTDRPAPDLLRAPAPVEPVAERDQETRGR
jgi:hypothetical protein